MDGTVLIGHGRADAEAVASGVRAARRVAESAFVETIRAALAGAALTEDDVAADAAGSLEADTRAPSGD